LTISAYNCINWSDPQPELRCRFHCWAGEIILDSDPTSSKNSGSGEKAKGS